MCIQKKKKNQKKKGEVVKLDNVFELFDIVVLLGHLPGFHICHH